MKPPDFAPEAIMPRKPGPDSLLGGLGNRAEIKRRYPTPVSFTLQAPSQRSDHNFVDIDPVKRDMFGTPEVRVHFQWDENTLKMWEHSKQVCEELFHKMGGVYQGHDEPQSPGWSLRGESPGFAPTSASTGTP